jgi:hypothetical protein
LLVVLAAVAVVGCRPKPDFYVPPSGPPSWAAAVIGAAVKYREYPVDHLGGIADRPVAPTCAA